jgi:hypothetical protein
MIGTFEDYYSLEEGLNFGKTLEDIWINVLTLYISEK